ncbi:MAG: helix-turn-helix transcriptional regulator [Burkholderiales bacterium]|nr:helix-turn-helix transcriptional regulator [Opitutaceae bacterium]
MRTASRSLRRAQGCFAHRPSLAIARAVRLIEARPAEIGSVAELASAVKLGVSRFAERFYAETGFTPAGYLRLQRIELAKRLMRDGRRTLTEIAQASGFSSGQHLATVFRRAEGMTPSAYLNRHATAAPVAGGSFL